MDDVALMCIVQGCADLFDDVQRFFKAFWSLIVECASLNQLHHDVRFALEFTRVKYSNNVGMVELSNGLSFVKKTRTPLRA